MDKILSLISKGESQTVEFKTSFQKEVIESVVAFANAKGGKIFIGVKDDGTIQGIDINQETLKDWINQIKVNTQPQILVDIEKIEIENKTVAVVDVKEYPVKAIRELLLNAIVHRDYTSPVDIQIKIFDNSITMFNPGKLYGDLTIEELHTDEYHSRARNKLIVEAFYLTGDIEKYGSGYIRVREEIQSYPTMLFEYKESGDGYLVKLSYTEQKTTQKTIQKTTQKSTQKTTQKSTREQIIELLKVDKKLTRVALSQAIGVSPDAIKQHLAKLQNDKLLKRVGGRKDGYWEVAE